jgi:hypothetical protein
MDSKKVSGRQAMERVLRRAGGPLKTKVLVERTLKVKGLALHGKTPGASLAATLAVSNKRGGVFVRTSPGVYGLRERDAS